MSKKKKKSLSPFAWFEGLMIKWFAAESSPAFKDDAAHFEFIRKIDGNCDLDAIQYLYDRLNIIDAKANALLTVNVLSLGVFSFVAAIAGQRDMAFNHDLVHLAVVAVVLAVVGVFLALALTRLQFDHVTSDRTCAEYINTFFQVTIARQKILALGRAVTSVAFVLYAVSGVALFETAKAKGH